MTIEQWSIDRPIPYAKNARKLSPKAIDKVAQSLQEFGWQQPLVVDSEGVLIVGHTRLLAAKKLKYKTVPVLVAHWLTPAQVKAYRLMDNRSHDETSWDFDLLGPEFEELKALEFNVELTGFSSREIEKTLLLQHPLEDAVPPTPEAPVSIPGDLWLLGGHRIMCGDSTSNECVTRLMDGNKASLFATDPPYLVDYQGGNHPQAWDNIQDTRDKHWDDYVDPAHAVEFYEGFLKLGLEHSIDRVPVYQWHADLRRPVIVESWKRCGLLLHQIIIWVKSRAVLTRSHFMWQHEPCAYGWAPGSMPVKPPCNETSVWTIDQIGESDGIHPTQKPVALFKKPMLFHTHPGDICFEPFSGSGTCIAAAEVTGRRCFAMEISPAFVDVAIVRWQNLTGKEATLEGYKTTFAEAKRGRQAQAEDAIKEGIFASEG